MLKALFILWVLRNEIGHRNNVYILSTYSKRSIMTPSREGAVELAHYNVAMVTSLLLYEAQSFWLLLSINLDSLTPWR